MLERTLILTIAPEPRAADPSPRVRQIGWHFGLPSREPPRTIARRLRVPLGPGRIVFVTGPSGAGKSALLDALAAECPGAVRVAGELSPDRAVIDSIAPDLPLARAMQLLVACGLGEPRLWMRRFGELSEGERFRARLARALDAALADAGRPPVLCDDFAALLHARAARAVACNLRKLVTRLNLTLVLAAADDRFVADLRPDVVIRLHDQPTVERAARADVPGTVLCAGRIEPGAVRDYDRFAAMHYRAGDRLGFVDRVFLLRESPGGEPIGIAVFAMPAIELALRNHATLGRFLRNPHRLNRELRVLRRLIMHPDVRGCGLGHWFVRRTLPRVGTRFVECLAAMGGVNPVLERAGMTRIGRIEPPRGRLALLERLRRLRTDPFAPDFAEMLRRCPRVRRLIERTIFDWRRATTGGRAYTARPDAPRDLAARFRALVAEPPVYYLWDREGEFPPRSDRHNPHAS